MEHKVFINFLFPSLSCGLGFLLQRKDCGFPPAFLVLVWKEILSPWLKFHACPLEPRQSIFWITLLKVTNHIASECSVFSVNRKDERELEAVASAWDSKRSSTQQVAFLNLLIISWYGEKSCQEKRDMDPPALHRQRPAAGKGAEKRVQATRMDVPLECS